MSLNEWAMAVSVSLTVVFLFYVKDLLSIWFASYITACRKVGYYKIWIPLTDRNCWTETEWLCVGIFSGFLFSAFDNVYWGITWALTYYEVGFGEILNQNGSKFNIFFRQLGGIWAVWCHVVAARMRHDSVNKEENSVYWFAGIATLLLLVVTH